MSLYFSDVTFVLFCLKLWPFVQSFNRSSICMRPESHTQLPLSASFFVFVSSFFLCVCFFGDSSPNYFCVMTVFSLNEEYVVHFPLTDGAFLRCDDGLDFLHQLVYLIEKHFRSVRVLVL